ncbi:hypothetical protein BLOT_007080, partial [Blomia tropicalis]
MKKIKSLNKNKENIAFANTINPHVDIFHINSNIFEIISSTLQCVLFHVKMSRLSSTLYFREGKKSWSTLGLLTGNCIETNLIQLVTTSVGSMGHKPIIEK